MSVNLDSYLATHAGAIKIRAERATLLANNLANADTPNFKARDFSFSDALKTALNSNGAMASKVDMQTSQPNHLESRNLFSTDLKYRMPTQFALDGNTVQADIEKTEFTENSVRYEASLQLLGGKISGLMKALRGE